MSTDMQEYSTENQEALIALYATTRGLEIVRTYADEGRSGLNIKGRPGLAQLIADVCRGNVGFETILVYDVSRWGRFQDADESAHYEFICREAGVSVQYCAEEFENDGSLAATIIKTIKRAMAGEYSRELSAKVFAGKCTIIRKGFRAGGQSGFGLRRMVVDKSGSRRGVLEDGQQKFLHTDRTILVPGPVDEVQTVRWMFDRFTRGNATLLQISNELNERGIKNGNGAEWRSQAVRDLLSHEKYIGTNVFNQTSQRLKQKTVRHPPHLWVKVQGAFEAIVDKPTFDLARMRLSNLNVRHSKLELLDRLSAIWCRYGSLSTTTLQNARGCPSTETFVRHFGSLVEAFKLVGYPKLSRRPVYSALRKSIGDRIIAQVEATGGTARNIGLRRQSRLLINEELVVNIALAHWFYRTYSGKPRWMLKQSMRHHADFVVLARFAEKSQVCDYLLLPGVVIGNAQQLVGDSNHVELDAFKAESLKPLTALLARQGLPAVPIAGNRTSVISACRAAPEVLSGTRSRGRKRNAAARLLFWAFRQHSNRMAAFIDKCHSLALRRQKQEAAFRDLLSDRTFCKMLFDEGLDSLPAHLSRRLS